MAIRGNTGNGNVENCAGDDYATLTFPDGTEHKLKLYYPTLGSDKFLDIRDLYSKTGFFTYDPGFGCTASCSSAVTFVDGPEGRCLYRGYAVGELVEKSTYLEVAHLLLTGNLPTKKGLASFQRDVKQQMMVHEKMKRMFDNFNFNAHPMAIMVAVVGGLSAFFSELDQNNSYHRWLASVRLIAKVPTLAALAYKTSIGQPSVYPRSDLTYSENFLNMMFATPLEPFRVNPIHAKAIDAFLILHADHEQNASTSTVRIAASSQANPYACIAAGIASLWGPAHGGANEAVIEMLDRIGTKENIPQYLEDVKNKKEGVRLMGFGHRVYKNYDPRAQKMGQIVKQVLEDLRIKDHRLDLAEELERVALADPYFKKRKLYPNVDFYSGIMLTAIGIPTSMFTVLFAVARTCGWITQWKEMIEEGNTRIGRPRQLYLGECERQYVAIGSRPSEEDDVEDDDTPPFIVRNASRSNRDRMMSSFLQKGPDTSKPIGRFKTVM
eukprot:GEMP01024149.1.p1 GENE.GEMP01024149.1~~GEMP01024149.1.p1  ORF type:complete len:495 (+),score=103.57 GEMP01024149.1:49-1533(+)